ncbi:Histone promoter control 2 (HPC2) [Ophiocordyceps sinensis CO18]|uniref:Histone promoter control 2 (HPC2) n=1 Tax=Ophiocordyceps sinensis (strain Co18 / CGMCC 3.14243) TaxID=911162 RepID=T5A7R4_OPHSC|nr:Histone promoter control 2 (HPC2) [Ophiocordyceps sinensis CO18]
MGQESESRSILDFGKARPGEELQAPTIVLRIPIKNGETNKYINFTRLAEERYGWDALHPRLAANRDRKARIAAAAASLEKVDLGRESGDEMSVDLSDGEGSNPENGGTSGPDAQAKPKKKRNFKEDQYDVDDDFVDDSEMLWEAQAAASRDGFFVYSGPLVPEVERPPAGRDGQYGQEAASEVRARLTFSNVYEVDDLRNSISNDLSYARGGTVGRKPRITKSEKLQREREKADRESAAQLPKTPTNVYALQPTTPSFTVSEIGA